MVVDALVRWERDVILSIAPSHGARNVRVFGSRARGQSRHDSDLDLLVALDPHRTLLDIVGLKQDLEDRLHCRVDIVTEAALSPYLRDDVPHDAVAL